MKKILIALSLLLLSSFYVFADSEINVNESTLQILENSQFWSTANAKPFFKESDTVLSFKATSKDNSTLLREVTLTCLNCNLFIDKIELIKKTFVLHLMASARHKNYLICGAGEPGCQ